NLLIVQGWVPTQAFEGIVYSSQNGKSDWIRLQMTSASDKSSIKKFEQAYDDFLDLAKRRPKLSWLLVIVFLLLGGGGWYKWYFSGDMYKTQAAVAKSELDNLARLVQPIRDFAAMKYPNENEADALRHLLIAIQSKDEKELSNDGSELRDALIG